MIAEKVVHVNYHFEITRIDMISDKEIVAATRHQKSMVPPGLMGIIESPEA